jgi:peptide/nickel transport system substrate-binding protein
MRLTLSNYLAISAALLLFVTPASSRMRPHYGGTLRIEMRGSAAESDQLRTLVAESLTLLDERGEVHPLLAEAWQSQNGDRRWQFTLRGHIMMHDGTPLTGRSVAQILSSQRFATPWRSVQGTDSTLNFDSDTPMPNLPALLASANYAIAKRSADGTLIGTGPFKLPGPVAISATLFANDDYWGGRPYVDQISLIGGRAVRSQWLDLSVGRTDLAEVPGEFLRRAQQDHLHTSTLAKQELVLITVSPQLSDLNLRRAISASIDRMSLANVVFQKQGQASATLLPNSMTGYGPLIPANFDLAISREFRAKSYGIPPLTIAYDPNDATLQLAAERIALNARDAGIVIQAVPANLQSQPVLRLQRVVLPSTDPSSCLVELQRSLSGQFLPASADLASLFQQEKDLLDQAQLIPLLHLPVALAASDRIRDYQKLSDASDVSDLWIEERR